MSFTEDQENIFANGSADLAVLFRLDTDPVCRYWSGAGDFSIPSDSIEPGGAVYKGSGALGNLPELSQLINGVAERVSFTLSGCSPRVLELADSESSEIRNKTIRLGLVTLDSDLQQIGPTQWIRSYEADVLSIARDADVNGNISSTVTLSVGSVFTGRRRAPIAHFTDPEQKRRSPDDRFCERTYRYSNGVIKTWPRF